MRGDMVLRSHCNACTLTGGLAEHLPTRFLQYTQQNPARGNTMGNTALTLEHREATYEDILNLPEHLTGEIINGELYTQPRPTPAHARASSALGAKYVPPFDFGDNGPGGWIILDEPELHLGSKPHIIVPDLAGWRRERLPALPETAWFETAPDWVCEVMSPSTAGKDRVKKMPVYAEFGVGHLWLVDPLEKTLEAYRLHEGQWLRIGAWADDDVARIEPFEAVELSLTTLWAV